MVVVVVAVLVVVVVVVVVVVLAVVPPRGPTYLYVPAPCTSVVGLSYIALKWLHQRDRE